MRDRAAAVAVFFAAVSQRNASGGIALNFWAEWCAPCTTQMNAVFDKLATMHTNVRAVKVSADDADELATFCNGASPARRCVATARREHIHTLCRLRAVA